MVFFGVELERSDAAREFVSFVRDNEYFTEHSKGSIATREEKEKYFVFVEMRLAKMPWWAVSLLALVAGLIFGTGWWTYALAGFFILIELIYLRYVWYGIFLLGLRKRGYIGKRRLMGVQECLGWLVK